jgi:hypothetical protein
MNSDCKLTAMNKIEINDLKQIFNRIIEKLEFEEIQEFYCEKDLYNKIPAYSSNIYNNINDRITIGSLKDDIECLNKLAKNADRPCTYVDFDRTASLLNAISEKLNPPLIY